MTKTKPKPNAVDIRVGKNLKLLRQMRSMSQSELAEHSGVTFQQIQKYENGKNRLSASRIYTIANALEVNISDFFMGLENNDKPSNTDALHGATKQELALIKLFREIKDESTKRNLLSLLKHYDKNN